MGTLLIALGAGAAFIIAYHTYGRWLGRRVFELSTSAVCPSVRLRDDSDYVPTRKSIVFGHHFTSIAGTGPIVGPAIAVMWGWLPALLWVVFGSIFIGAVHDFGSLVVSLRNNGQTVGDIAGRVLSARTRILFLLVLFLALTIVIAIFGLVIAKVFVQYPAAIFPCMIQIPIAVGIGVWLHRHGKDLLIPSIAALGVMYLTVVFGDWGPLHAVNTWMASWPVIVWVAVLLAYSYVASVLPVWTLLQPRDYINSLQLITALGLVVVGLIVAAMIGGAPPVEGAERQPLAVVAPMVNWSPEGAPPMLPFLFITIACGAISGFHCLVSSGTSSKQLESEPAARFVGFGAMLTEGFLATVVILACVAGLGLGDGTSATRYSARGNPSWEWVGPDGNEVHAGRTYFSDVVVPKDEWRYLHVQGGRKTYTDSPVGKVMSYALNERHDVDAVPKQPRQLAEGTAWYTETDHGRQRGRIVLVGGSAFATRYQSWSAAGGLAAKVGAFVDGSANFLKAMGIPGGVAVALMGVLVASFAGTTLDTACRLQRYVVQELARAVMGIGTPRPIPGTIPCAHCNYDLRGNDADTCPECGWEVGQVPPSRRFSLNPLVWLQNKHGATLFAVVIGGLMAALPAPGLALSLKTSGTGGMILWPMFGATNQLLGGLAFLVIAFYLWRRKKPIWFIALPLVFMLVMPAWAMVVQLPGWLDPGQNGGVNWPLVVIALATLALEAWMIVEALLVFPRARGLLEEQLPGSGDVLAAAE